MVTDKIGTVSGYAALFNEPSLNLAKKGEAPWCETIIPGGLTLASNVMLDRHHLGFLAVASTSSRTLRCGFDETGLWFEADLYPQSGGYDVHNALRGGRSLAASFTMIDRRAEREGDLDIVWAATVVGLALLRPGRAVYSGTRAWLADEVPRCCSSQAAKPEAACWRSPDRRRQARAPCVEPRLAGPRDDLGSD
jgi:hypothetical protein